MTAPIKTGHLGNAFAHSGLCVSRIWMILPLIAVCIMSFTEVAVAQHTTICLGFDPVTNEEIPIKTNLYVGDQNSFTLKPGKNPTALNVKTTKWTLKTTSTLGVVTTTTYSTPDLPLLVNRIGTAEIKAEWSYNPDSSNMNPADSVSPTYTITSSPPSGVVFVQAGSLLPNTPCAIYGGAGGGAFWFQIKGGQTDNAYNMIVMEKIDITTPALGPQFGGNWVWNNGTQLPTPGNAPYLEFNTSGQIRDIKTIRDNLCDLTVAAPGVIHQYTQAIGARVKDMDNTDVDITLGWFVFTVTRISPTECNMSITQIP